MHKCPNRPLFGIINAKQMGKLFLAIWLFLGSLVGASHLLPVQHNPLPTASPTVSPTIMLMPTLAPTPTLAPGQKAFYTFYIQATSHKASNEELTLNTPDTGKKFTVDIGTLLIVNFWRVGKFQLSASSPQAIFTNFGRPETIHLPNNALGAYRVYRSGFGTIQVIEAK
jgi:hypothetical protein